MNTSLLLCPSWHSQKRGSPACCCRPSPPAWSPPRRPSAASAGHRYYSRSAAHNIIDSPQCSCCGHLIEYCYPGLVGCAIEDKFFALSKFFRPSISSQEFIKICWFWLFWYWALWKTRIMLGNIVLSQQLRAGYFSTAPYTWNYLTGQLRGISCTFLSPSLPLLQKIFNILGDYNENTHVRIDWKKNFLQTETVK